MNQFLYKNKNIAFSTQGNGEAILFIHGYLESKEVWESFTTQLNPNHQIISIDIPGHGASETLTFTHHMQLMADVVNELLIHLNLKQVNLVGHSMGAYVALAFAKKHENKVKSLVLMHSSIYADNEEKRMNRAREIEFIEQDKLPLILKVNLPKMFANHHMLKFVKQVGEISQRAETFDKKGICALLRGMMLRQDMSSFIKNFKAPILFVFGEQDNYIPKAIAEEMVKLKPEAEVLWLSESGHMGFIEEADKTRRALQAFWNK